MIDEAPRAANLADLKERLATAEQALAYRHRHEDVATVHQIAEALESPALQRPLPAPTRVRAAWRGLDGNAQAAIRLGYQLAQAGAPQRPADQAEPPKASLSTEATHAVRPANPNCQTLLTFCQRALLRSELSVVLEDPTDDRVDCAPCIRAALEERARAPLIHTRNIIAGATRCGLVVVGRWAGSNPDVATPVGTPDVATCPACLRAELAEAQAAPREGGWASIPEGAPPHLAHAIRFLRRVAQVLADKNKAYGDSIGAPVRVFAPDAPMDILVRARLDDKLTRIRNTRLAGDPADQEDAILDLAGYLALLVGLSPNPQAPPTDTPADPANPARLRQLL